MSRKNQVELNDGDRVGDWIIRQTLGHGGMGTVYRCENVLTPRLCGAIKVVSNVWSDRVRGRFVREIENLISLRHPAVIRVLTGGEDVDRKLLYLVMELVPGEDLRKMLARGSLGWHTAARLFVQLADGLMHAHARGVSHRDIKPGNIMVTPDELGVLIDFGIALQEDRSRLTEVGSLPGTMEYIAPEFLGFSGETGDRALGDVHALGLVYYEAVTGMPVFPPTPDKTGSLRLLHIVNEKKNSKPLDLGAKYPGRLRRLIAAATDPDPSKRPSMAAFRLGLETLLLEQPLDASRLEETTIIQSELASLFRDDDDDFDEKFDTHFGAKLADDVGSGFDDEEPLMIPDGAIEALDTAEIKVAELEQLEAQLLTATAADSKGAGARDEEARSNDGPWPLGSGKRPVAPKSPVPPKPPPPVSDTALTDRPAMERVQSFKSENILAEIEARSDEKNELGKPRSWGMLGLGAGVTIAAFSLGIILAAYLLS